MRTVQSIDSLRIMTVEKCIGLSMYRLAEVSPLWCIYPITGLLKAMHKTPRCAVVAAANDAVILVDQYRPHFELSTRGSLG
jgi:hypothetical protein